jgi:hypothetical protein
MSKRVHSRLHKLRLRTIHHLDGRTTAARRARTVARELLAAFDPGAVTPAMRQAAERAGMFTAIAEDMASRKLAGLSVCGDELFRAEGCARRAIKAVLAMKPEPVEQESPGLAYGRARRAAMAAQRAAQQQQEKSNERK